MSRHIVDPTFFDDVINMYGESYDAYVIAGVEIDELGMQKSKFEKHRVEGSLQTRAMRITQSKSGNTNSVAFDFYCKSIFKLSVGDFMVHDSKLLMVKAITKIDQYSVRHCELEMTDLNEHRDLREFIRYLTGDEIL